MESAETIVFFHAHPDDEAIFTGGTMALLSDAGHRVVVVMATSGELGIPVEYDSSERLGQVRQRETERAGALLGVSNVSFLGYRDSGMAGSDHKRAEGSFAAADPADIAERLAAVLVAERATALVVYDAFGIYGHPDHVQVYAAGRLAAERTAVRTWYEATIDREYLHFVETHLVEEAILSGDLGLARSHLGVPTVMVTTTVAVSTVLDRKRAAMAAHASQIPETTSALQFGLEQFSAVYGCEWFIRHGPPGPLERLEASPC